MFYKNIKVLQIFIYIMLVIFLTIVSYPSEIKGKDIPLRSWDSEQQRLKDRGRLKNWERYLNSYIRSKKTPLTNVTKSLVLPGLGQLSCNNKVKGTLFMSSSLVGVVGSIYLLIYSNNSYDKYKTADNINDIEKYWDESEQFLLYSEIVAGATATIWFFNVVDAYFTTNNYNKNKFEEFYYSSKESFFSPKLYLSNNALQLSLVYKF